MRALVISIFVIVPISVESVLVFCFFIGFLWLATVPLTNALVGQLFGLKYLATLAGIVFCSHQLGSFSSILLGGYLFDATGSYTVVWQIAIGLGIVAGLLHLPINEMATEPDPVPAAE